MIKKTFVFYCSWVDRLVSFIGKSISLLMPCIALVIAYEVCSRYVFNQPTIWAYDTSLFLSSYLAALGGAYAYQKNSHINVDILYLAVSNKTKRVFNILTGVLGAFFMLVLMMMAYEKFSEAVKFDYRKMSNWAPPTHHFWMMLMVAGGLIVLQISCNMIKDAYYILRGEELLPEPASTQDEDEESSEPSQAVIQDKVQDKEEVGCGN